MDPTTLKQFEKAEAEMFPEKYEGEELSPLTPINLETLQPEGEEAPNDSDVESEQENDDSDDGEAMVDEDAESDEDEDDTGDVEESDEDDVGDVDDEEEQESVSGDEKDTKESNPKTSNKVVQHLESILAAQPVMDINDDEEYDESDEEDYLEKFDSDIKKDIIQRYHPDLMQSNYDEISALVKVIRDEQGNIVDPIHKTIPILTKFERARVLGLRAKQINNGAEPFIQVPENIIEGHIIAEMELEKRVLPFIVVRPLPNGKKEYWRIQDLKLIDY